MRSDPLETFARPRPAVPLRGARGLVLGGVRLRWKVWRQARQLDEDLARGTDPLMTDALSLRAGQLRSPETRAEMAKGLRAAIDVARLQQLRSFQIRPLVEQHAVTAAHDLLLELAAELRDAEAHHLNVQGLAMTWRLLRTPDGPLYRHDPRRPLLGVLRSTLAALREAPVRQAGHGAHPDDER